MNSIQMVDLKSQYHKIKQEVLKNIEEVIENSAFIQGGQVKFFEEKLSTFVKSNYCIACANGTDALQIAMMALDLKSGDEIIVPAFTYVATVETAALLGIKLRLCDVKSDTFNIDPEQIEKLITSRTKAIVVVHLFGQIADMESIIAITKKHNLYIIEDNAQAIGADYTFSDKTCCMAGVMGHIGTTSFFPSKNLGCYGDGGAIFTQDEKLATKIRMIANHGQGKKYYHDIVGINSRLDTLQAAVLLVKLKYLEDYIKARQQVAAYFDQNLVGLSGHIKIPAREVRSTHVFHQYSILVNKGDRDEFKSYLEKQGIPSMVYYPLPIHLQKAYSTLGYTKGDFPIAEDLCNKIISLPMHTELDVEQMKYICEKVLAYFIK
jgi:UDP-2-acetamido-2-deoxy-ribo-hexuluronate aminotransferase